ncbi:MAG: Smr/MutS family protein [Bauldia sp.]
MTRGRRRTPTEEELGLWQKVTETVVPIGRSAPPAPPKPEDEGRPAMATTTTTAAKRPAAPPSPVVLDRRTTSRLARGAIAIDARIDLHGLTQAAAHRRLAGFLGEAQASGVRAALVITGRGRPGGAAGSAEERGVLRRVVPLWLAAPEFRSLVAGFGVAAPIHGGAGAIYVRIRRRRSA